MKTKFLPTMIGAILAGGMAAAQADVQVFGHIDVSVDSFDTDAGFGGSDDDGLINPVDSDDVNLNSNTSSVGFKGSEDLGNGLKAIFKIDFQYDVANQKSDFKDRDQWLGLKGNFGQVRIGTISTGYKSHGAMIDPMYRTSLQGRSNGLQSSSFHSGAGEDLEGRADNTFRYDSPSFNGLKVVAHYTLDSSESGDEDEDPFGIGASYSNGGILVFADYMAQDGASGASGDDEVWKVGGKYSLNNFAVMGQYEDSEEQDGSEFSLWHIGGSYTMGNNMIYVAYGQGEDDSSGADLETEAWTIAGTHSLSKRTKVYAGFNTQNWDDGVASVDADSDLFSVGMKHKF